MSLNLTVSIVDGAVESPNFRVHHAGFTKEAVRVANAAERALETGGQKWFGKTTGVSTSRCDIHLHPTGRAYSQATGLPESIPGVTSIQRDGARILAVRIDVRADAERLLDTVIPHEVAHVAVARGFGEQRAPLWISEAMCILCEPREQVETRLRDLGQYRRAGMLMPIEELMGCHHYPDARRLAAHYAQGASVVALLVNENGSQAFTEFVRDGQRQGFERALIKHYGFGFAELEQRWHEETFHTGRLAARR